jgi:hypothetical protein
VVARAATTHASRWERLHITAAPQVETLVRVEGVTPNGGDTDLGALHAWRLLQADPLDARDRPLRGDTTQALALLERIFGLESGGAGSGAGSVAADDTVVGRLSCCGFVPGSADRLCERAVADCACGGVFGAPVGFWRPRSKGVAASCQAAGEWGTRPAQSRMRQRPAVELAEKGQGLAARARAAAERAMFTAAQRSRRARASCGHSRSVSTA